MEPVRKIIHRQDAHDDSATSYYTVCVKNEHGKVHLSFCWCGYFGDPFKHEVGPDMTISPCNCDAYSDVASPWLKNVLDRYYRDHSMMTVTIARPLEADARSKVRSLLDLFWVEDPKKLNK